MVIITIGRENTRKWLDDWSSLHLPFKPGGCGSESFCKEIWYDCGTGIASDEDIALVFRAYVEPATAVGPAWGVVILDRILKFTPRAVTGPGGSKSKSATIKLMP